MKKLLLLFACLTLTFLSNAQDKNNQTLIYASIVGEQFFLNDGYTVKIDFGRANSNNKIAGIESLVQIMNYLSEKGWELSSTYINTFEKTNKSLHIWVISKKKAEFSEKEINDTYAYLRSISKSKK